MKTKLKVSMSAVAAAAVLMSPAIAKQVRPTAIPANARASAVAYGTNEGGPYTPSIPTPRYGKNLDFHAGGADK